MGNGVEQDDQSRTGATLRLSCFGYKDHEYILACDGLRSLLHETAQFQAKMMPFQSELVVEFILPLALAHIKRNRLFDGSQSAG